MASLAVGSEHREPSLGSPGLVVSETEHSTGHKGVTKVSTAEKASMPPMVPLEVVSKSVQEALDTLGKDPTQITCTVSVWR